MNRLLGHRVRFLLFPAVLILFGLGVVLRLANAAGLGTTTSSDPIPLTPVDQIGGLNWKIDEKDGYIYTGVGSRLYVLDATGPNTPTVVGRSEPLGGYIPSFVISDSYAYIATNGRNNHNTSNVHRCRPEFQVIEKENIQLRVIPKLDNSRFKHRPQIIRDTVRPITTILVR